MKDKICNTENVMAGKRLLLLGGSGWADAIRRFADARGITLAATGNDGSAAIFRIADERHGVDSTDHEAMKRLIRDRRIDGVYMGGSEKVIAHACRYLGELGLPCYCTPSQWEALQDKARFKALCRRFGLPCAEEYRPDSPDIRFPVVAKPTDGHSGVGVAVCRDAAELRAGYAAAVEASPSRTAIVERFVPCGGSIYAYYTFSGGRARLAAVADKRSVRYDSPEAYVACLHLFESGLKDDFSRRYGERLTALFRHLGIREGSLWMEVFAGGGRYCFNEAGFRYAGLVSAYPVAYFSGVNQIAADITFALTGSSTAADAFPLFPPDVPRRRRYCMYYMHLRDGRIATIEGAAAVRRMPQCVFLTIVKAPGDVIGGPRTLQQILGAVHIVFDTDEELPAIMHGIHQRLHVTATDGSEMLADMTEWAECEFTCGNTN